MACAFVLSCFRGDAEFTVCACMPSDMLMDAQYMGCAFSVLGYILRDAQFMGCAFVLGYILGDAESMGCAYVLSYALGDAKSMGCVFVLSFIRGTSGVMQGDLCPWKHVLLCRRIQMLHPNCMVSHDACGCFMVIHQQGMLRNGSSGREALESEEEDSD